MKKMVTNALERIRLQGGVPCLAGTPVTSNRKGSLKKQLGELFDKANLPPDCPIGDPRKKIKIEGDGTYGIQGDGPQMSPKDIAHHRKLDANLKRSRKGRPVH